MHTVECSARRGLRRRKLMIMMLLVACEPELMVGEWSCPQNGAADTTPDRAEPIAQLPWSNGFEEQFCGYSLPTGFCYAEATQASYTLVTSPVHSGQFSAAFSVTAGPDDGHQARCVRQGTLPTRAYYGAWFYIPAFATNTALWNLIHFQGGDIGTTLHGLWDVSLVNGSNGSLELVLFDFLNGMTHRAARGASVPIDAWFHLELYLVRAADATGEVTLYKDGQVVFALENIVTDDSNWGQWYVGNLATGLTPRRSILYVDDVTIRSTR